MTAPRNTIRTFALVCVAVTSVFLMAMAVWYTVLLAAPDWCGRAIGSEQVAEGGTRARSDAAVEVCMQLLHKQVAILGLNSHVLIGIIALCLGVLVVIVIAGGRLSFKASRDGIEGELEQRSPPPQEGD